jgi:hypothetical protein
MSRPRLYIRTVLRCADCPTYQEPPLSRHARSWCTAVTPIQAIDDPSAIAEFCPLPVEGECR